MDITIYKCSADKRQLDKTNFLAQVGSYSGLTPIENLAILAPEFYLSFNSEIVPEIMGFANYCYIPVLARYYYIVDKSLMTGGRINFTCTVDPLMTYKDEILNCIGVAVRNENEDFSFIPDEQVPTSSYLKVSFLATASLFDNSETNGTNFILNVAGGGSSSDSESETAE